MRTIRFYKTASGRSPIEEFLDGLDPKHAQRVTWVLRVIEDFDDVPSRYFRKMAGTDALWEVRANAGSRTFRLLGFFDGAHLVVLVHGFSKKSRKTPLRAIRLAEERKADYLKRKRT